MLNKMTGAIAGPLASRYEGVGPISYREDDRPQSRAKPDAILAKSEQSGTKGGTSTYFCVLH